MTNNEDLARLWDMLRPARVSRFVAIRTREDYLQDEILMAAVERKIEIIGEAAYCISTEFKAAHPEVPWPKIQGQRHILAHDDGDIEHDRIWDVATFHVRALAKQLEAMLHDVGPETPN